MSFATGESKEMENSLCLSKINLICCHKKDTKSLLMHKIVETNGKGNNIFLDIKNYI